MRGPKKQSSKNIMFFLCEIRYCHSLNNHSLTQPNFLTLNFGIIRLTQIPTQIFGIIRQNGFILFCFPYCGESRNWKGREGKKNNYQSRSDCCCHYRSSSPFTTYHRLIIRESSLFWFLVALFSHSQTHLTTNDGYVNFNNSTFFSSSMPKNNIILIKKIGKLKALRSLYNCHFFCPRELNSVGWDNA